MKRFILTVLIFCVGISAWAETKVHLKSGRTLDGTLLEQTDQYIKIRWLGMDLTYWLDDIEKIVLEDGTVLKPEPKPHAGGTGVVDEEVPAAAAQEDAAERMALLGCPAKVDSISIPHAKVAGRIHGQECKLEQASIQGNLLKLVEGNPLLPRNAVYFILFTEEDDDSLENKVIRVDPGNPSIMNPRIQLYWRSEGDKFPREREVSEGYVLYLKFGTPYGVSLPGEVFLCVPTEDGKTLIKGTFTAEIQ
ncbi:MAG: hypothetical protein GF333_01050 [Candidatus Omnitrophica bacterium]|nr:hypothetical protein [Candidatus Omnitrophota bacterium]